MERKVSPLFLEKGMFVTRLSRPWIDTPFWIQGFLVRTDRELDALRRYSDFAYIDTVRGCEAEYYMEEDMELPSKPSLEQDLARKVVRRAYPRNTSLRQELGNAIQVLESSTSRYDALVDHISSLQAVDMGQVEGLVRPMIDSIIRQPDALVLLANLRRRHRYSRSHAVDSCVFALAFGRYLGLKENDLLHLGSGVLLLDIGNIHVPAEILNRSASLTDDDLREVHKHVYYGVKLLQRSAGLHEDILNTVLTHHERFDGSGYPNGLRGLMVPVYGRMAALVDCFDAMIRHRPHADAMTAHGALQEIYRWRGSLFQAELVDLFMEALGTYPDGSLVELNNGAIALVIAQNPKLKLQPVIVPIRADWETRLRESRVIDLARQAPGPSEKPLRIIRDAAPADQDIDTDVIYLQLNRLIGETDVGRDAPAFFLKRWLMRLLNA